MPDDSGQPHSVIIERCASGLVPFGKKRFRARTRWNIELKKGRLHLGSFSIGDHRRGRQRNKVRLDITGMGCRLGFMPGLSKMFVRYVQKGSLQLRRLDIAVDVEAPFQNLVVFQTPTAAVPRNRMSRRHLVFANASSRTGQYLGSQLLIYDGLERYKAAEQDEPNRHFWRLPRHVEQQKWSAWTRLRRSRDREHPDRLIVNAEISRS